MESILRSPNPRDLYEREEDNMPLWAKILYRYGVPSAIALGLVWLIATRIMGSLERIENSQHEHASSTAFYLRQICLSNAEAGGHTPYFCDPSR